MGLKERVQPTVSRSFLIPKLQQLGGCGSSCGSQEKVLSKIAPKSSESWLNAVLVGHTRQDLRSSATPRASASLPASMTLHELDVSGGGRSHEKLQLEAGDLWAGGFLEHLRRLSRAACTSTSRAQPEPVTRRTTSSPEAPHSASCCHLSNCEALHSH